MSNVASRHNDDNVWATMLKRSGYLILFFKMLNKKDAVSLFTNIEEKLKALTNAHKVLEPLANPEMDPPPKNIELEFATFRTQTEKLLQECERTLKSYAKEHQQNPEIIRLLEQIRNLDSATEEESTNSKPTRSLHT